MSWMKAPSKEYNDHVTSENADTAEYSLLESKGYVSTWDEFHDWKIYKKPALVMKMINDLPSKVLPIANQNLEDDYE